MVSQNAIATEGQAYGGVRLNAKRAHPWPIPPVLTNAGHFARVLLLLTLLSVLLALLAFAERNRG